MKTSLLLRTKSSGYALPRLLRVKSFFVIICLYRMGHGPHYYFCVNIHAVSFSLKKISVCMSFHIKFYTQGS